MSILPPDLRARQAPGPLKYFLCSSNFVCLPTLFLLFCPPLPFLLLLFFFSFSLSSLSLVVHHIDFSNSFLRALQGSDRVIWIDLAAGPIERGPATSGNGAVSPAHVPFVSDYIHTGHVEVHVRITARAFASSSSSCTCTCVCPVNVGASVRSRSCTSTCTPSTCRTSF